MVIGPGPGLPVVNIDTEDIWQLDKSSLFGGGAEIDMEVFIDNNIASWPFTAVSQGLVYENERNIV